MKKIMLSLAMALVSVCASAQVYIGGTAGISSNKIGDGDSKTAYTLMPEIGYEFNNKWEAGLEIGIKKGDVCELREVPEATTFIVAPYVRYTAVETKLVNLFVEGTIGYGSVSKGGGDSYDPFCDIFYNKLGSFPCIHSATLTGRTYTPLAV